MSAPTSMGSFVSTLNVTTSGPIALSVGASVGDIVFVSVVGGSASIGAGVTDSKSNTWIQVSQAIAASGAAGTATGFYSIITSALTTSDTVTVTRTPTGSLTAHVMLITGQSTVQLGNGNSTPTANSVTAVTTMPSGSVTVNAGDLVLQVTMMGTGYGTVTPNASPAFTTFVTVDSTGGSNPRGTNVEYRQITAGQTFTPQITVTSGKAYSAVAVVFAAVSVPAPATVAAIAAVPAVTVIVGGAATATPTTVQATAAIPSVTVSTFKHPTLALIGDSLTYRSGDDANPPSREAATRAVMTGIGFETGAFYWWGVGGKGIVATDTSGKTTLQNITDAVAQLGSPIDYVVIALGTNNTTDPDATLAANVDTVLNALDSVATRVFWIGLGFYGASNSNALRMNPIIAGRVALHPNAAFVDWNTYIHSTGVYDPNDWLATFGGDATHLTTAGWPKRDGFIAAQLQGAQAVGTVAAVAAVPAPAAYRVTASTVAGVTAVPGPTVTTVSVPAPSTVAAVAVVPAPAGRNTTAATVTAVTSIPAVFIGSSPGPTTVTGVAAVPSVTVTASTTRAAATVTAVAAVPAPAPSAAAAPTVTTVTGVATVPAPAQIGPGLAPSTVTGVTAVPAVAVKTSRTITPTTVTGVTVVPLVTVVVGSANPVATVAAVAGLPAVTATTTAYDPPVLRRGGWGSYLAILEESRQAVREERAAPVACPNDGEPLRAGPHGGLYCPWGDYDYELTGRVWA